MLKLKQLRRFFKNLFPFRSPDRNLSEGPNFSTTAGRPSNFSFVRPKIFRSSKGRTPLRRVVQTSLNANPTSSNAFRNTEDVTGVSSPLTLEPPAAEIETQLTQDASLPYEIPSSGFSANNIPPSQVAFENNLQNNNTHRGLEKMRQYIIPGAEYDASSRDSPPRCHPGTRTQILQDIQARVHDPGGATRMVWINGPAGVGKSAIMQTLAETELSRDSIFATLFFSRPNERDDPQKAFPTLAYGLTTVSPEYRDYVAEKLQRNPNFLAGSLDEQFQNLFVTPFLEKHVSFDSGWILFLDGLDECHGEIEQRRIVKLIRKSLARPPGSIPFTWIIASRPEPHLMSAFTKAKKDLGGFWELNVPIDSDRSSRDVEHYLHARFLKIREKHLDSVPSLWPSERDFLILARASSGLFVLASTLVEYLSQNNPASRLTRVLDIIEKSGNQAVNVQQRPFRTLDLLFIQIMSQVPLHLLPTCQRLLGFYLLEAALAFDRKPVPLLVASNTLELDQGTTYAALQELHSVLTCPPPDEAEYQPIHFHHASFSDFLRDASRSQQYHIDLSQVVTYLWRCQTRILHQYGNNCAYSDVELSWVPTDYLPRIQVLLVGSAQRRWMKILVQLWAAAPGDSNNIRLLIDQSSLIDVLHDLGPVLFLGIEDIVYPTNLFTWLDRDAPEELRQRLVVEMFPLQKLDLERLFKSLCVQRWCWTWRETPSGSHFAAVDLTAENFTAAQWAQAKEALWRPSGKLGKLVLAHDETVRVVGFEPAKYHILVGPISTSSEAQVYYVLPYAK